MLVREIEGEHQGTEMPVKEFFRISGARGTSPCVSFYTAGTQTPQFYKLLLRNLHTDESGHRTMVSLRNMLYYCTASLPLFLSFCVQPCIVNGTSMVVTIPRACMLINLVIVAWVHLCLRVSHPPLYCLLQTTTTTTTMACSQHSCACVTSRSVHVRFEVWLYFRSPACMRCFCVSLPA